MRSVALVTGGASGIGAAVCRRLAADGYDVAFCYRSSSAAAASLERELRDFGVRSYARRADVSESGDVQLLLDAVEDALGPVTTLVGNAAIREDAPLALMTEASWRRVLEVDLTSAYLLTQGVLQGMMRAKRGAIVMISALAGLRGSPGQTNYAAAKAGLVGFTKSLAQEVGGYGVRANVVVPGFINTEGLAAIPARSRDLALARIALRRFGRPEEVADLVAFLASDASTYLTGEVITIDGAIQ